MLNEKIIVVSSAALDAAEERLAELKKAFGFNEVVAMLRGLMAEVDSMPIASRFSPDKKIFASVGAPPDDLHPMLKDMTEAEHKRWQLKGGLKDIETTIIQLEGDFRNIFLDMQATATE